MSEQTLSTGWPWPRVPKGVRSEEYNVLAARLRVTEAQLTDTRRSIIGAATLGGMEPPPTTHDIRTGERGWELRHALGEQAAELLIEHRSRSAQNAEAMSRLRQQSHKETTEQGDNYEI